MVSADNLNLDVLEVIFSFLRGNDLLSVALVSSSFFDGVIPRLYARLLFRHRHAKRYPNVITPFSAVLGHSMYARHVRHIEIQTIPSNTANSQLDAAFIRDCTKALAICTNIISFKCSRHTLAPIITSLYGKDRLESLHLHSAFTSEQSDMLLKISGLKFLAISCASWNMLDVLPRWCGSMSKTLTVLILFMAGDLNEVVLSSTLSQLPNLLGLHVIGCSRIDHTKLLSLLNHTPLLESLSFVVSECAVALPEITVQFPRLRNISLDVRSIHSSLPSPNPLSVILACLKHPAASLTSFVIRLPEQRTVAHSFVQHLLSLHGLTLKNISFIDCSVSVESIRAIATSCVQLERLDIPVPVKEYMTFTKALANTHTLRTMIDTKFHGAHGAHPSLVLDHVLYMMERIPSLVNVLSDNRQWAGKRDVKGLLKIQFRPITTQIPPLWFLPKENRSHFNS